jgi:hypothetical protein
MVRPPTEQFRFNESLSKAKQALRKLEFTEYVYPQEIMEDCLHNEQPPRMIFVPDRALTRMFINFIVRKDHVETEEKFLLKFGLLFNFAGKLKELNKPCTPLNAQ